MWSASKHWEWIVHFHNTLNWMQLTFVTKNMIVIPLKTSYEQSFWNCEPSIDKHLNAISLRGFVNHVKNAYYPRNVLRPRDSQSPKRQNMQQVGVAFNIGLRRLGICALGQCGFNWRTTMLSRMVVTPMLQLCEPLDTEKLVYIHVCSTTTSRWDRQRKLNDNSLSILCCRRRAGN